jgi:hypothetical protein
MMLTDAADVLRAAGLNVHEMPGWQGRGEDDGRFAPVAIVLHHDAMGLGWDNNPANDDNVPAYMAQAGNPGAQFWVKDDGTWWTLAAGRKWHAGLGHGFGMIPPNSGNTFAAGVETDHTVGDPWPVEQVDAINRGCAALVAHYGWDASTPKTSTSMRGGHSSRPRR